MECLFILLLLSVLGLLLFLLKKTIDIEKELKKVTSIKSSEETPGDVSGGDPPNVQLKDTTSIKASEETPGDTSGGDPPNVQ